MSITFRYQPPKLLAPVAVRAAGESAVTAGAEALLEASQPLVPVESGALVASGKVSSEGLQAAVCYGYDDGAGLHGANTAAYAVVQHEHLENHHPNGGEAKYLERPMRADADKVAVALAVGLREVFGL